MTNFKEDISHIRAFIFDIDGVLSTQSVALSSSGTPLRTANLRDGFALQLAVKMGYHIAIISGAHDQSLRVRFESLGITDIYLQAAQKEGMVWSWSRISTTIVFKPFFTHSSYDNL